MRINSMQLRSLDSFFQEREQMGKEHVASLQVSHIRENADFDRTIKDIKRRVLLTPATIGDPSIVSNRQVKRQVPPNYHMILGGEKTFEIVTVKFPTTGNLEKFQYRSNGGALAIRDIYVPDYDSIHMEVEVETINKAEILANANKEIETTRTLISQNNPHVEQWNLRVEPLIDSLAAKRRKDLLDLYS